MCRSLFAGALFDVSMRWWMRALNRCVLAVLATAALVQIE
jgi:hypothetical protein